MAQVPAGTMVRTPRQSGSTGDLWTWATSKRLDPLFLSFIPQKSIDALVWEMPYILDLVT